jgi:3-oxoacyl-[acyl-carrier-protein] synthase-3
MHQSIEGISIEAIAACVPKQIIDNSQFEDLLSTKEIRKFEKITGVKERRFASHSVTASDLGFEAASKILKDFNCKTEIKALIFLSQTSDYKIPFTSNILQDKLGLKSDILCLDINAGCAGFVQGLSVSFSILSSLSEGKVLFIVAETLSKILSKKDKSTSMLFGDGASAILIGKKPKVKALFSFYSDGANHHAIKIEDGGYRNPFNENSLKEIKDELGNIKNKTQLFMDGPKVFDFTLREIVPSIEELLKKYSIAIDSIDYFLFHQSNRFIIRQIASKLGVSIDKVPINIDKFGNTSGVTIPLLIVTNKENFEMNSNRNFAFVGYGSGLNWGVCVIKIDKSLKVFDLLEI